MQAAVTGWTSPADLTSEPTSRVLEPVRARRRSFVPTLHDNFEGEFTMLIDWIPGALKSSRGRRRSRVASTTLTHSRRTLEHMEDRVVLSASLTLPASITYNEGGAAVQVAPTGTITDSNANLLNGNLVLSEGLTADAGDTIAIKNQGTAAGEIGVNGSNITYGGTAIGTFTGGTAGSPLVVSLNANADAAAATALLQDITFSTTDTASVLPRDLTGILTDGLGGLGLANEAINVIGLGPTLNLANNVVNTVAGSAGSLLASGATLTDSAVTNLANGSLTATITNNATAGDVLSIQNGNGVSVSNGTVSVNGTAVGTVTGGTNGSPLTVNFNSSATVSDAQAILQQLQLSTQANGSLAPRTVQLSVNDGTNAQVGTATLTANIQAAIGPVLSLPTPSVTFSIGGTAAQLAAGASLTDPSVTNLNGGSLTVSETANANVNDVISLNQANGITVNGNTVSFNGTAIGTLSGGVNGAPLTINFNSTSATTAAVQAVIQDLTFSTSGTNPSLATRTVQLQLNDGTNTTTAKVDVGVSVTGVLGPVLNLPTATVNVTAGGQAALLGNGITLSDTSVASLNGGKLTVSLPAGASTNDVLSFNTNGAVSISGNNVSVNGTAIGTLSGGTNGQPLTVDLNSSATVQSVQTLLQNLNLQAGAGQTAGALPVSVSLTDGTNAQAATGTLNVNVQAGINLTLPTGSVNVSAGGSATALGNGATLTDNGVTNFNNGVLTVSLPAGASTSDKLSIGTSGGLSMNGNTLSLNGTAIGTVSGGTNGQPLTVTFNANANAAAVQSVIANISLQAGANQTAGPLAVNVSLTDGTNAPAALGTLNANVTAAIPSVLNVTSSINIKNSAPHIIDAGASISGINASNLNGATLNIQLLGGNNKSSLGVQSRGTGVRLQGSNILVNGQVVGTVSGSKTNTTITFNANATVASVNQILDALSIRQIGNHSGSETVQMQFTDSAGVMSNMSSTTVTFHRGHGGGNGGGNGGGGGGWWNNY
jgi:hypothetical protein